MTEIIVRLTRLWYYFRLGYGLYLTLTIGMVSNLVVLWALLLRDIPSIQEVFGHFIYFGISAIIGVGALATLIGWVHVSRSPAFASENEVFAEANPFNYKLLPGYWPEVFAPVYLELLQLQRRLLESHNLLDATEKAKIEQLEGKLNVLIEGGFVGQPPVRIRPNRVQPAAR